MANILDFLGVAPNTHMVVTKTDIESGDVRGVRLEISQEQELDFVLWQQTTARGNVVCSLLRGFLAEQPPRWLSLDKPVKDAAHIEAIPLLLQKAVQALRQDELPDLQPFFAITGHDAPTLLTIPLSSDVKDSQHG